MDATRYMARQRKNMAYGPMTRKRVAPRIMKPHSRAPIVNAFQYIRAKCTVRQPVYYHGVVGGGSDPNIMPSSETTFFVCRYNFKSANGATGTTIL